jgi:hypothetical protein
VVGDKRLQSVGRSLVVCLWSSLEAGQGVVVINECGVEEDKKTRSIIYSSTLDW